MLKTIALLVMLQLSLLAFGQTTTPLPDPCQIPQQFIDLVNSMSTAFGNLQQQGLLTVTPTPGTNFADALAGAKYIYGALWYYKCLSDSLNTQVTSQTATITALQTRLTAAENSVTQMRNQLQTIQTTATANHIPVISNIKGTCPTVSSCTVTWSTDTPTRGYVYWGASYGVSVKTTPDLADTALHTGMLNGLIANHTYYFQVCVADANGNFKCQPAYPQTFMSMKTPAS